MLYEPGYPVSKKLTTYVESDWNDYLDHWGLEGRLAAPDPPRGAGDLHQSLDDLAKELRRCVHSLTADHDVLGSVSELLRTMGSQDEIPEATMVEVLGTLAEHTIVHDSIKIQLGFEAAEELCASAEERILKLLSLLALRSLSERTLAYLDVNARLVV